jgi:hypothetical protein
MIYECESFETFDFQVQVLFQHDRVFLGVLLSDNNFETITKKHIVRTCILDWRSAGLTHEEARGIFDLLSCGEEGWL